MTLVSQITTTQPVSFYLSADAWSALAEWFQFGVAAAAFAYLVFQTRIVLTQTAQNAENLRISAESLRISTFVAIKQSLAQLNQVIVENKELAPLVGDSPEKAIQDLLSTITL